MKRPEAVWTREKSHVVSKHREETKGKDATEAGGSQIMDPCKDCEFILKVIQKH